MELISRENVLNLLQRAINYWHEEDEGIHQALEIEKVEIEKLPIIESRPKGKWIDDTGLYATCSNCKENLYQAIEYKFCPFCGAEMER